MRREACRDRRTGCARSARPSPSVSPLSRRSPSRPAIAELAGGAGEARAADPVEGGVAAADDGVDRAKVDRVAVRVEVVDHVGGARQRVAVVEAEDVVAGAAGQRVAARTADEDVRAGAAAQRVVADAAGQPVGRADSVSPRRAGRRRRCRSSRSVRRCRRRCGRRRRRRSARRRRRARAAGCRGRARRRSRGRSGRRSRASSPAGAGRVVADHQHRAVVEARCCRWSVARSAAVEGRSRRRRPRGAAPSAVSATAIVGGRDASGSSSGSPSSTTSPRRRGRRGRRRSRASGALVLGGVEASRPSRRRCRSPGSYQVPLEVPSVPPREADHRPAAARRITR